MIGLTANTLVEGIKESGRRGDVLNAVGQAYVEAVEAAGGVPVIIPFCEEPRSVWRILENLDGILLTGGGDITPALFGEEPHPALKTIDVRKDQLEKIVISRALAKDIPLLGICRGIQILNVIAGGTLIQDIPSWARAIKNRGTRPVQHMQKATDPAPTHSITIQKDSQLDNILGLKTDFVRVNSYHHQAVGKIAPGFVVTATAPDGIVEAIESQRHRFVLGVQFHPEMGFRKTPVFHRIFQRLVREAGFAMTGFSRVTVH